MGPTSYHIGSHWFGFFSNEHGGFVTISPATLVISSGNVTVSTKLRIGGPELGGWITKTYSNYPDKWYNGDFTKKYSRDLEGSIWFAEWMIFFGVPMGTPFLGSLHLMNIWSGIWALNGDLPVFPLGLMIMTYYDRVWGIFWRYVIDLDT